MHHGIDIPKRVWESFSWGDIPVAALSRSSTSLSVTPLEGGLSGSRVWKICSPHASYCLKSMPPDFPVNLLRRIHAAGNTRRALGMQTLAAYLPTRQGESYLEAAGHLWELQSWQEGASPSHPLATDVKRQVVQAVARFHHIVHGTPYAPTERGPSPGITFRTKLIERWQQRPPEQLKASVSAFGKPQQRPILYRFVDSFQQYVIPLRQRLAELATVSFPLSDCLGDPRPENFLFREGQLTGQIDLSSLRLDNWALDLARLGSELAEDGRPDWDMIFDTAGKVAMLSPDERRLAWGLDLANILLTGLNWLEWLVVEKRRFASPEQVANRLAHLERRLAFVADHPAWKA